MAEPIEMPFCGTDSCGPKASYIGWGVHRRHLANTIEWSVHGGDAAFSSYWWLLVTMWLHAQCENAACCYQCKVVSVCVTTVLQKQRNRLKCCLGCRVGARNHVLGWGPNPPRGMGNYRGRLPLHYKAILVAWVKTARSSMANDTVTE